MAETHKNDVGEESRGHNSSAQVLRFSQTGAQVAAAIFHYVGTGGSGVQAIAQGLAVQANGDILAVGGQTTFSQAGVTIVNGLARLKFQNGSLVLDPGFGKGGTVVNNMTASSGVVIQDPGHTSGEAALKQRAIAMAVDGILLLAYIDVVCCHRAGAARRRLR